MRSTRIDWFVVETNKLLIRLEKLLSYESSVMDPMKKNMFEKLEKLLDSQSLDPTNKRKAFEKSIVPWAPDEDVKYCPTCGDKFSLAKRKHHCRLCGSIMCGRCSDYLSYTRA
ncbi:rabenosyn-5-like, partial [Saccoglossus kowalevskii]|uniref:Rabenosyn-5-like n=1 Tax=Saccoglossus kowalevskii TaxID=10224 RepID=A0ABM0MHI6_SACKO